MGMTGTFDPTQVLRPFPRQMAFRVSRHTTESSNSPALCRDYYYDRGHR